MSEDGDERSLQPVTLDLSKTRKNIGSDESLLREIVSVFIEDVPQILAELQAACLRNDYRGVALQAHSLKGLCDTFGAEPARTFAQRLELDATNSSDAVTMEKIHRLVDSLNRTIAALQHELRLSA